MTDYSFGRKLVIEGTMRTFEQDGIHIRVYQPTASNGAEWAIHARAEPFTTPESPHYSSFNEPDPFWSKHCPTDSNLDEAIEHLIAEVQSDPNPPIFWGGGQAAQDAN